MRLLRCKFWFLGLPKNEKQSTPCNVMFCWEKWSAPTILRVAATDNPCKSMCSVIFAAFFLSIDRDQFTNIYSLQLEYGNDGKKSHTHHSPDKR